MDTENSVSMEDTIRENVQRLGLGNGSPPEDEVEVAEPEVTTKPDKARDESGKFAKKDAEPEQEPEQEATEESEPAAPERKYVPKWKREALEKWALLPPEVQAEVEKRDQDFHKGIEQYKTDAQKAKEWDTAIAPYAATIQANGISATQAVQSLFAADHALRYGSPQEKYQTLMRIAGQYGVQVQQQNSGQQPQAVDPNVNALYQRLQQLEQGITQQQQNAELMKQQELTTQIHKFSQGREYFETLRPQMAGLLQSGVADSLESAYDIAFQSHPVTKPLWLAKQQESWRTESSKKAETAKKAGAVNVQTKGTRAPAPKLGTMEDTIRAKVKELGMTT